MIIVSGSYNRNDLEEREIGLLKSQLCCIEECHSNKLKTYLHAVEASGMMLILL